MTLPMPFHRRMPALLVAVLLCAFAVRALAQASAVPVLQVHGLGDQITLDQGWLFHAGDDPSWSSPTLNDRG